MGSWSQTGLTGEGHADLDSGNPLNPVQIRLAVTAISSPRVRVVGTDTPRNLRYAGSYGMTIQGWETWSTHIAFESELYELAHLTDLVVDQVRWMLADGVTADIDVFW